jgi:hypothetical protein
VLAHPAGDAHGRNHHSVGMGAITEMATSAPGNCSIRPKNKAPIAEILGGTFTLFVEGKPVGSGRVEKTEPIGFVFQHAMSKQ